MSEIVFLLTGYNQIISTLKWKNWGKFKEKLMEHCRVHFFSLIFDTFNTSCLSTRKK